MCKLWRLESEGLIDQQLLRRIDNVVFSANDHVYVHSIVINNDSIVVCRHTIPLEDNYVLDGPVLIDRGIFAQHLDVSIDFIIKCDEFA
ncbi:MAG: hypothetical protein AGIKBDMD_00796 [Synergistaceae bacterium]